MDCHLARGRVWRDQADQGANRCLIFLFPTAGSDPLDRSWQPLGGRRHFLKDHRRTFVQLYQLPMSLPYCQVQARQPANVAKNPFNLKMEKAASCCDNAVPFVHASTFSNTLIPYSILTQTIMMACPSGVRGRH